MYAQKVVNLGGTRVIGALCGGAQGVGRGEWAWGVVTMPSPPGATPRDSSVFWEVNRVTLSDVCVLASRKLPDPADRKSVG